MRRLKTSTLLFVALFLSPPAFATTAPEISSSPEEITGRANEAQPETQSVPAESSAPAEIVAPAVPRPRPHELSREEICQMIESAANKQSLPLPFFARLIWRESRFNPQAVSPVGAQGIAQFMPRVATGRGLADPFNPLAALYESALYLRELLQRFGNIGLAAAAYNAGPKRVHDWLAKRGILRRETRDYVANITGHSAAAWASQPPTGAEDAESFRCNEIRRLAAERAAQLKAEAAVKPAADPAASPAPGATRIAAKQPPARNGVLAKRGAQPPAAMASARLSKVAEQRRKAADAKRNGTKGSGKQHVAEIENKKTAASLARRAAASRNRLAAGGRDGENRGSAAKSGKRRAHNSA